MRKLGSRNITPPPLLTNRKIGFSYGFSFSSDSYSGFTIIEVALVLAIAGLIFLVVFLALPALQNSQADTARREDVGRVISALQSYEADNGGDLSGLVSGNENWSWTNANLTPLGGYIGKIGSEIRKVSIAPFSGESALNPGINTDINIFPGSDCSGNVNLPESRAAVTVRLTNQTTVYCQNL